MAPGFRCRIFSRKACIRMALAVTRAASAKAEDRGHGGRVVRHGGHHRRASRRLLLDLPLHRRGRARSTKMTATATRCCRSSEWRIRRSRRHAEASALRSRKGRSGRSRRRARIAAGCAETLKALIILARRGVDGQGCSARNGRWSEAPVSRAVSRGGIPSRPGDDEINAAQPPRCGRPAASARETRIGGCG